MSQIESIEVIKTAIVHLVKTGLWDKIPQREHGAIVLEVGPLQSKCIWRSLAWFCQFACDPNHELSDWAINAIAIIRTSDPIDLTVVARIDSPSEPWQILTIEKPTLAPDTVQQLLKLQQPKS
jgi:hypothetical protein